MNHECAQTTAVQQVNDLLTKKLVKTFATRIKRSDSDFLIFFSSPGQTALKASQWLLGCPVGWIFKMRADSSTILIGQLCVASC